MSSILQRISEGDRSAVAECLDEYGGLVWSLARRYLGAHADAEDATQDIFLSIWSSAGRFDPARGSEPAFVATIAHRRLIDIKRSARVRQTVSLERAAEPTSGDSQELFRSDSEMASKALQHLPSDERETMQMAVRYGLSHAQIARATDQPIGTIKTRLRRAMKRLRETTGQTEHAVASNKGGLA